MNVKFLGEVNVKFGSSSAIPLDVAEHLYASLPDEYGFYAVYEVCWDVYACACFGRGHLEWLLVRTETGMIEYRSNDDEFLSLPGMPRAYDIPF